MATLVENAIRIKQTFEAIKDAIIGKGVTPTGGVDTYADAISQISQGGGGSGYKPILCMAHSVKSTDANTTKGVVTYIDEEWLEKVDNYGYVRFKKKCDFWIGYSLCACTTTTSARAYLMFQKNNDTKSGFNTASVTNASFNPVAYPTPNWNYNKDDTLRTYCYGNGSTFTSSFILTLYIKE